MYDDVQSHVIVVSYVMAVVYVNRKRGCSAASRPNAIVVFFPVATCAGFWSRL